MTRRRLSFVVVVALALGVRVVLAAGTYTSSFALTENPISESANWVNGAATGLDWHNVRTNGTQAFGTQDGSTSFTDSIAVLTGSWGNDQTGIATARCTNVQTGSIFEEVEILLRFSIAAHSAAGYEFTWACRPSSDGNRYVQINRWNGSLGSFTLLNGVTGPGVVTGDTLKATAIGTVLTIYVNGSSIFTYDTSTGGDGTLNGSQDSTVYSSGRPGIGFYLQGGTAGLASDYGLTSISLSDGTTPSPQLSSGRLRFMRRGREQ